ncbi:putative aspartate glutamate racemase [Diplogelasinospora grovesii]|uniref:Aspartate glutamate racemase n=1 Tax=Diplogelasinospora grovesii TaxID=303347 RepID=A0AAN6S067_9PEZI|nr:putative aspartate glutamate racemase [Diplogelasinospora grovesii]
MKTLGLLGGMTYHSTILYYGQINAHIQRVRGGSNAASLILHSFDFGEMSALFAAGRWDTVTSEFVTAAKHMRDAGAEGIAIGCNIGYKVAGDVEARVGLPVLHIADFTAQALRERQLTKVALLATRAAMEDDFISARLAQQAGVEVLVPEKPDRDVIDAAIFNELSTGTVTEETRKFMVGVAEKLVQKGAQGVVLACTDLQFVLKPGTVGVSLFDTLDLHTRGLAQWALQE